MIEDDVNSERARKASRFKRLCRTLAAVLCAAFLALVSLPGFTHDLPPSVRQALKQGGIPRSAIGVYVHEIGAAHPRLAVNAGLPMNPASVMKLVTTFAGLELLGPAYTWRTELYADGLMQDETLQGNLVIKGYGDPKLNLENFWLLTRRLRQTGLREITGDLVLDSSHFDLPTGDPAAFDGKAHRAYNVLPEALLVNYRTLGLRLVPQPSSKNVRVIVDPLPSILDVSNNLKLTDQLCNEWRDALGTDILTGSANNGRISVMLNGSFSTDCGEKTLFLSFPDTAHYTHGLFRQFWEEQGGVLRGHVRVAAAPESMSPLEVHQSPPLVDIVRDINKFSNNTAARQLYLALGSGVESAILATAGTVRAETSHASTSAYASMGSDGIANADDATDNAKSGSTTGSAGGTRASLAKSEGAMRKWLAARQLDFPELVIENGSGLSRKERISASHMGALLLAAFQSSVMPEFISSLPIAAVDGTMKTRLNGSATAGRAHIKTGLLEGVKTMAGYVLTKSGKRAVVVFFVNHPKSGAVQPAMDALLEWVYER